MTDKLSTALISSGHFSNCVATLRTALAEVAPCGWGAGCLQHMNISPLKNLMAGWLFQPVVATIAGAFSTLNFSKLCRAAF